MTTTPKRKGHATSTSFKPGQSGNPAGKKKMDPLLKEVLAKSTLPLYRRGIAMMKKAEKAGDLRVASTLLLGLLKKSLPDAAETIQLANPDGTALSLGPTQLRAMSDDDLATLKAIAQRAAGAAQP